jgi:hypothetical protein
MAILLMFHNIVAHAANGKRRIQTTMKVTSVPAVGSALPHEHVLANAGVTLRICT